MNQQVPGRPLTAAAWLLAGVLLCFAATSVGQSQVSVDVTLGTSELSGMHAGPGNVSAATDLEAIQDAIQQGSFEGLAMAVTPQGLEGVRLDAPLYRTSVSLPGLGAGPLPESPLDTPEARAVAGVGTVAGLALAAGLRPLLALMPLYARLDRTVLLEHPVRRELMRRITGNPGANVTDLQAGLDLGWGSLLYHLQRLEAQGFVISRRWGRSRRYFLNQRGLEVRAPAIRALKAPNARELADLVAREPGRTQEELSQALQLSKSVVSKYAKRLAEAGLVQREVGRNCLRLFPTADLRELLHGMAPVAAPAPAPGPVPVPLPLHEPSPLAPAPMAIEA